MPPRGLQGLAGAPADLARHLGAAIGHMLRRVRRPLGPLGATLRSETTGTDRHQVRRLFALPGTRPDLPVEPIDLLIEFIDPPEQQPAQFGDRLRQAIVPVFEHRSQLADPGSALGSDNAELGEVAPKRVDRLRALAHQQVARVKEHLCFRLDRHEVHGRTLRPPPLIASASFLLRLTNGFT